MLFSFTDYESPFFRLFGGDVAEEFYHVRHITGQLSKPRANCTANASYQPPPLPSHTQTAKVAVPQTSHLDARQPFSTPSLVSYPYIATNPAPEHPKTAKIALISSLSKHRGQKPSPQAQSLPSVPKTKINALRGGLIAPQVSYPTKPLNPPQIASKCEIDPNPKPSPAKPNPSHTRARAPAHTRARARVIPGKY